MFFPSTLPKKGLFITFEGEDGTGKSTQIKYLARYLESMHLNFLLTREPGGSPGAELAREVLLSPHFLNLFGLEAELFLFSAARLDHIDHVIRPAILSGKLVLCDRFLDSSRVYQGMNSSLSAEIFSEIEHICINGMMPDLTLIFDLPAKEAVKRRKNRKKQDRFEKASLALHQRRCEAFLDIAKKEPERCKIIDASLPKKEVADQVFGFVFPLLRQRFSLPKEDKNFK